MNLETAVPHLASCLPLDRREICTVIKAMCGLLEVETGKPTPFPELVITDDAGSEECNRAHIGCVGPTNILSFPIERQKNMPVLGSLVLAATVLRRESLLYGQDPTDHAVRLLAHGMAHLLGLEHGPEMWNLCDRLETVGRGALTELRG